MATTLIVETCNATEALCKIFHPTCVSWNSMIQQWKYSLKPTKKFLLHLLTICILELHFVLTLGLAVFCRLYKSDLFPVSKLLLVSTLIGVPLSWLLLEDGFLMIHGSEMVTVGNWATECIKKLKIYPFPKPHYNLMSELGVEINKALKSKPNVDIFGIVSGYTFVSTVQGVFLIAFAIVISDADLVYIVSFVCFNYFGLSTNWLSEWYMAIVRCFSTLYILQCIAVGIPTFVVLSEAVCQGLISGLKYLEYMDLTVPNIKLYRTIFVAKKIVSQMLKWFGCIFLSGSFFTLLLTVNLCLYGKKFMPNQLYIFQPFLAFSVIWSTALVLHFGYLPYKLTCKIIEKWKNQLALGTTARPKYMKLILYSLQPIGMPVGNIGIVDRDIQFNYFSAVLSYVVNTSLIFKDLL